MPSCGEASRMLFIIMLTNMASNCLAAVFSASGLPALADWRSAPMSLTSRASLPDRSTEELVMMACLNDFQLGVQRTSCLHRLQDGQQVLRRRADRIERLD